MRSIEGSAAQLHKSLSRMAHKEVMTTRGVYGMGHEEEKVTLMDAFFSNLG